MKLSRYIIFAVMASLLLTSVASVSASTQLTFGSPQNLSNNVGLSQLPVVTAVGSDVYVAWIDSSYGHGQVVFDRSLNNGIAGSWAPLLSSPFNKLGGTANAVQMYATGSYVFLTWVQGKNVAFAVSSNNGGAFAVTSNLGAGTDPAIRAVLPYVYLDWNAPSQSGVYFTASSNDGSTFATPALIGTQPGAHEATLAVGGNNVYAVWAGAQSSGEGVYVAVSSDHGTTFTTHQLNIGFINRSREPMAAASGSDVYVTWTSDNTGTYNAYVSWSTNSGSSFSTPLDLGPSNNARELQVAASGSNGYVTFRGSGSGGGTNQFICVTNNDGTNWSCPTPGPFDLSPSGAGSEVGFGSVAVDGSNVYVLWPQPPKGASIQQMWFDASQDSGKTWAGAQQVSSSNTGVVGMSDPGAQGPMVAASGGHSFTVWEDTSTGSGDIYFNGS